MVIFVIQLRVVIFACLVAVKVRRFAAKIRRFAASSKTTKLHLQQVETWFICLTKAAEQKTTLLLHTVQEKGFGD